MSRESRKQRAIEKLTQPPPTGCTNIAEALGAMTQEHREVSAGEPTVLSLGERQEAVLMAELMIARANTARLQEFLNLLLSDREEAIDVLAKDGMSKEKRESVIDLNLKLIKAELERREEEMLGAMRSWREVLGCMRVDFGHQGARPIEIIERLITNIEKHRPCSGGLQVGSGADFVFEGIRLSARVRPNELEVNYGHDGTDESKRIIKSAVDTLAEEPAE